MRTENSRCKSRTYACGADDSEIISRRNYEKEMEIHCWRKITMMVYKHLAHDGERESLNLSTKMVCA